MIKVIMDTKELAELLGVGQSTIRGWVQRGMPKCLVSVNRGYRYYLGDVYIWLLTLHKTSNSNKWQPRYLKVSKYVTSCYCPESVKFSSYVVKRRNELGLNGPKSKSRYEITPHSPHRVQDIAYLLDVTPNTVCTWIRNHDDFPDTHDGPYKSFLIDVIKLFDWMKKQKKQSKWRKYWLRLDYYIRTGRKCDDSVFGDLLNVKEK